MPKWIPLLHDPKQLKKLYAKHTVREIAAMVNCVPAAVTQALHRHEIPTRRAGWPEVSEHLKDKEWLTKRYADHTIRQIATQLGCSQITVWRAMKALDIALNTCARRPTEKTKYRCKVVDGKIRKVHRLIMEEHLGRKLTTNEHVHHIDGNPRNNALENLTVLTKAEHHRLHGSDLRERTKSHGYRNFEHQCQKCRNVFLGGNRAKYCQSCRSAIRGSL